MEIPGKDLFGPKVLQFNKTFLSGYIHSYFFLILLLGYGDIFQCGLSAIPRITIPVRSLKCITKSRLQISVTLFIGSVLQENSYRDITDSNSNNTIN